MKTLRTICAACGFSRILAKVENASEILLIIVSAVLAVFLVVAIVAGVYVISVLKQVKRVVKTAENVADNVEAAAQAFERSAGPLAAIKIIGGIIEQVTKSKKRKG